MNNGEAVWADWVSCGAAALMDGVLRCSLSLSPNALPDSAMYSSGQFMCGSWYVPKFQFKEGSFTQMYMSSLKFLDVPCASL